METYIKTAALSNVYQTVSLVGFFLLYYEGFRTLTFCPQFKMRQHIFTHTIPQGAFPCKTFDKAQLPIAYSFYRHMLVYGPL